MWVGDAIIPSDYFPPTVNKFMGTDVHNTGKTPEEVKYEVVSPMPGEQPIKNKKEFLEYFKIWLTVYLVYKDSPRDPKIVAVVGM